MSTGSKTANKSRARAGESEGVRKRYEKPRVLSRESLEAMAGVCPRDSGGKEDVTCTIQNS